VLAPDALLPETLGIARTIAANAPIVVRQAKKAIGRGLDADLRTGLAFEVEAYNRTVDTEDRHEGVRAFAEKRKPKSPAGSADSGRRISGDDHRAQEHARLVAGRAAARAMQRAALVPHHDVATLPQVGMDELRLRAVLVDLRE